MPRRVKVTGGELIVDVEGEGPPIVLVHSGVTDGRQWEAVAERVRRRATVIRYDRRGYGRSAKSRRGRFSAALDLLELLDALKLDRVVACGNSAGGLAVLEAAVTAPERFARLLLLAPALPEWEWQPDLIEYAEAEETALAAGDFDKAVELNLDMWVHDPVHREAVAVMQRRAFENQRKRPFEEFELGAGGDICDRLDAIACPVHLMVGEHDRDEFRAIAWHLADRIAGARAEEVPGAGHLLGLEQPDLIAAAL